MSEEYTPSEEDLRLLFALSRDVVKGRSVEEWWAVRDLAFAEFDRAIDKIKADAWDKGWDAGLDTTCQYACGDCKYCVNILSNPYKEETK